MKCTGRVAMVVVAAFAGKAACAAGSASAEALALAMGERVQDVRIEVAYAPVAAEHTASAWRTSANALPVASSNGRRLQISRTTTLVSPVGASLQGPTLSSLTLSVHQDIDPRTRLLMEATHASGFSSDVAQSMTATRIGVEYMPARNSAFGVERATVSLKMNSNFGLRFKRGGPMVYMRSQF